jgi:5-methylcytosine-specific restriction endonuclease McrA
MSRLHQNRRWAALRTAAKRRDGYRCVKCGARGRLEVDHIKPVRTHPELAFDLGNLQAICAPCHIQKTRVDNRLAESDPRRERWRELIMELLTPSQRRTIVNVGKREDSAPAV